MLSDILMWNKIGRIVTLLAERLDITSERALDIFYTSATNTRLHNPSTLLYTFSDRYIVDDIIRELQNNKTEAMLNARKAIEAMRTQSALNGNSEMTMDDINREIHLARIAKKATLSCK